MAGIKDFVKKWKVNTPVPRTFTGLLPGKGSTFEFQADGVPETCTLVLAKKRVSGFHLENGRLVLRVPGSDKVVIIEHVKAVKGGRPRLKGLLKVAGKTMSGTWGAESGGGGGTGDLHPASAVPAP